MKLTRKRSYSGMNKWTGRANNFYFTIGMHNNVYYFYCNHLKKDINFNSLWEQITFKSLEEVKEFCEKFDYKKHHCTGLDSYITKSKD